MPRRAADLFALILPAGVAAAALTLVALQLISGDQVLRPRLAESGAHAYPSRAVAFLAELGSPANVWCPLRWGGFVSWSLYPNVRVSMDGRFETVYPASVRTDHLRFWTGRHEVSAAGEYETTHILVPVEDRRTMAAVDASSWVRIYEDSVAVLYGRTVAAPTPPQDSGDAFVGDVLGDISRFAPR